jgi:hypothetical protein
MVEDAVEFTTEPQALAPTVDENGYIVLNQTGANV